MNPKSLFRRLFPTAHRLLVERALRSLTLPDFESVLIVGAGYDPYRSLFPRAKEYIRLDIQPIPGITDVVGDALALPFETERFNCLFASELLEHVEDPFLFAQEAARVLKPGGTIILTVPFMFHRHGDPHDYWRLTDQGLMTAFKHFTKVEVKPLGNSIHAISDLLTTAFNPYPLFFPLRVFNHLFVVIPRKMVGRLESKAPSGYILIGTK